MEMYTSVVEKLEHPEAAREILSRILDASVVNTVLDKSIFMRFRVLMICIIALGLGLGLGFTYGKIG